MGGQAGDGVGLRVDDVQPAGEAGGADPLEDGVTQPRRPRLTPTTATLSG